MLQPSDHLRGPPVHTHTHTLWMGRCSGGTLNTRAVSSCRKRGASHGAGRSAAGGSGAPFGAGPQCQRRTVGLSDVPPASKAFRLQRRSWPQDVTAML